MKLNGTLDSKIPQAPIERGWQTHKNDIKVVSPNNKRKYTILVVGTGLAGGSAAASLAELGYNVKTFCIQDSPRRAHSIAAQGGINAAKNYQNDNDSVFRLFYDTIKGGDFRARESNVYRLAELSANIIDQCAAQGVPFAFSHDSVMPEHEGHQGNEEARQRDEARSRKLCCSGLRAAAIDGNRRREQREQQARKRRQRVAPCDMLNVHETSGRTAEL